MQLFKNPFHFKNKLGSALALLWKVLEVHGVVEKEGHLYLVHIFNLLNDEVVIFMPELRVFLQVSDVSK